ncbi:probable serine hydrolase [Cydia splendana]|uniref:probable serine hydrolase n=1 Tax=Cydia splendana TaxID=1100963 RepID=UPI00211F6C29
MAKRLLLNLILNPSVQKIKPIRPLGSIYHRKLSTKEAPFEEIKIPLSAGPLAAKLWKGKDNNSRPILALHGWQDNAGTWDPLIPMLNSERPILAIDFPGHGLSYHIPPGVHYYPWELPRLIYVLKNHFKWDKVSLLAHSMGSIASMRFASLFPNDVDFYVAIDSLIADDYDLDAVIERYPIIIKKVEADQQRLGMEPPSYTPEEIKNIWHMGTKKSVALESVQYLMTRGLKPSSADPNKFYFSRDARLKHILFTPEDKKFVEGVAKRLICPTLYVKAIDSPYATDAFSVEMRELLEKNNKNFECHFVPGTHHVHLNNPEIIAPLIQQFLQKHNLK